LVTRATARRQPVPRRRQGWSLFDAIGFLFRLATAAAIALTLYMGAEELGRRAAISLPGQSFEVAVPTLIFGTLVALLILPIFGGWKGIIRELAAMTALCLLAIAVARGAGLLKLDSRTLPIRLFGSEGGPTHPVAAMPTSASSRLRASCPGAFV